MDQAVTQDERFIARVLFVNKLLKANNQSFQQFFWAVMRAKYNQDFIEIRPQGRFGDGGNDGYLPAEGHYFQVYGPIDPQEKVTEAAEKLSEDFGKLKISWQHFTAIRAYSFVFNDKYEATFVRIAQALSEIEKAHPTVKCRTFTAGHLEDTFMNLPADRIQGVLGMLLPDPAKIVRVDYGVLREVITHIMTSPSSAAPTRFGDLPDLGEKIRLNNLCSAWGDLIRKGARQSGHVDNYFSKNSSFMKQALRDHLVELYRQVRDAGRSLSTIPDGINREDLIFADFRLARSCFQQTQLLPQKQPSKSSSATTLKHATSLIRMLTRTPPMLLPDKHVKIGESILGLAAFVVANLEEPMAFDNLMAVLAPKFETPEWPAYHNTETVSLALCFLYSVGLVDVTPEGDLHRCD